MFQDATFSKSSLSVSTSL